MYSTQLKVIHALGEYGVEFEHALFISENVDCCESVAEVADGFRSSYEVEVNVDGYCPDDGGANGNITVIKGEELVALFPYNCMGIEWRNVIIMQPPPEKGGM